MYAGYKIIFNMAIFTQFHLRILVFTCKSLKPKLVMVNFHYSTVLIIKTNIIIIPVIRIQTTEGIKK